MNYSAEEVSINTNREPYMENPVRTEKTPLHERQGEAKGLKLIATSLSVMTAIVSVALAAQMYYGNNQIPPHGSVVSDSHECTTVGVEVLRLGGNAVDAAVAAALCLGVVAPHVTGLGAGGILMIFDQRLGRPLSCFDFRAMKSSNRIAGIPGFLSGLYNAHSYHGKLAWHELVEPSIKISRNGFMMSEDLAISSKKVVNSSSSLGLWMKTFTKGSIIKMENLANALQIVADQGARALYNGSLSGSLLNYFSEVDLSNYMAKETSCLSLSIKGFNIHVANTGSGGPLLLHSLSRLNGTSLADNPLLTVAMALKGNTEVDWPPFSGVHVAAMDADDIYVSIVSGLGEVIGSQILMPEGYILNNALEMAPVDDTGRPHTLFLPSVAAQEGQVCGRRLVVGGSDARDVLQLLSQLLFTNEDLQESVESPRVRIANGSVFVEKEHAPSFSENWLSEVRQASGWTIKEATRPYPTLNSIEKIDDQSLTHADSRGGGEGYVF